MSSESRESSDDGEAEPRTMTSRMYEAPAPRPSSLDGTGPGPSVVDGTPNPRIVRDNALGSISASISDDLSQKDKVEARQLSALMRPTPPKRTRAGAQDEAYMHQPAKLPKSQWPFGGQTPPGVGRMGPPPTGMPHVPPPEMGPPPRSLLGPPMNVEYQPTPGGYSPSTVHPWYGGRGVPTQSPDTMLSGAGPPPPPPRDVAGELPNFFQIGDFNVTETPYPSHKIMNSSHSSPGPRKRPRSELTSRSLTLREDLLNLDVHEIEDLIEHLDQRAGQLGSMRATSSRAFRYEILYRIAQGGSRPNQPRPHPITANMNKSMSLYFDPPQWTKGQSGLGLLQSRLPVMNFDLYLEKNKDISFIVYKTYSLPFDLAKNQSTRRGSGTQDSSDAVVDESIQPVNEALVNAVETLLGDQDEYASMLESFEETSELTAPYLFVYHQRNEWEKIRVSLPDSTHQHLAMMWDYIVQSQGAEYAAADSKIAIGEITPVLLKYLFKPGQLLVQRGDDGIQGWICSDWPRATQHGEIAPTRLAKVAGATTQAKPRPSAEANPQWELSAWHWEFDGQFQRKKATLSISIDAGTSKKSGTSINTLDIYPLKYASQVILKQIRRRGRNFWKCRKRALVSYRGDTDTNDSNVVSAAY